jgi:hypothetical protein
LETIWKHCAGILKHIFEYQKRQVARFMKVRWNNNSLRLRITPPELAALEQGRCVREEIRFPGSSVGGWSVMIQPGNTDTSLRQQGCSVLLQLGSSDRQRLSAPDAEGVYFEVKPEEQSDSRTKIAFRYYIEKDFPCIHPRAGDALEEPTETFPTPLHFPERN